MDSKFSDKYTTFLLEAYLNPINATIEHWICNMHGWFIIDVEKF